MNRPPFMWMSITLAIIIVVSIYDSYQDYRDDRMWSLGSCLRLFLLSSSLIMSCKLFRMWLYWPDN